MRRLVGLIVFFGMIGASDTVGAKGARFLGKWRAQTMQAKGETKAIPDQVKILVEFNKGGAFVGTVEIEDKKEVKTGTWKAKGKTLFTEVENRKEEMTFEVKGDILTLSKIGPRKGENLILKRVK
ncbi:MAG: hypothetical protein V1754_00790 [Pseudomonadota bacterium]